jgi:tol-pal system protein YbgF
VLVASAASSYVLAGCARTAEERHLDDMREEIERLQVDRDRANEPGAGGLHAGDAPAPGPGVARADAPPPQGADTRALGGPSDSAEDGPDTDDKTPRPSIRVVGAGRGGRYGARGEDVVQQSNPDEPGGRPQDDGASRSLGPDPGGTSASRPPALDPEAKRAYDAAIALVNARQYDKALDALAAFLVKWPDHPYANNAMYWRGECYFAKGDWARAAEQFEGTITRYPAGSKVPDALLKLGMCNQKLGNPAKAKEWFDRLSAQFPQSEAARRIPPAHASPLGPASEDSR